jgi:pimeloyl-ACP methyl ester carboxylesterase
VLHPERVRVPVTIVHGSSDRIAPLATADDLHRRLPRSALVAVAGGSHMLPNTHAALIVNEVRKLHGSRRPLQ